MGAQPSTYFDGIAGLVLEQLSNDKEDRLSGGFYAQQESDELRCPGMEVDQLLQISDVTARVQNATRGMSGSQFHDAHKAAMAQEDRQLCAEAAVGGRAIQSRIVQLSRLRSCASLVRSIPEAQGRTARDCAKPSDQGG